MPLDSGGCVPLSYVPLVLMVTEQHSCSGRRWDVHHLPGPACREAVRFQRPTPHGLWGRAIRKPSVLYSNAVPLDAVYSTDYKRTQSTALPTAMDQGLMIQSYEPDALGKIAEELIRNGQDALVVGHSNTTAVLAGLLVGEEMGSFDESIYNRVYQVVVSKDDRRLHVLHTSFDCSGR